VKGEKLKFIKLDEAKPAGSQVEIPDMRSYAATNAQLHLQPQN